MNHFIPTSRSNPCINCSDTKGDCRTASNNPDMILCKKVSSQTDVLNFGWRFGGVTNSLWGKVYTNSRPIDELQKEEWKRERLAAVEAQLAEKRARLAVLAGKKERNQYWLDFAKKNPLTPQGLNECLKRGLTDAVIKQLGYYSYRGSVGCLMFSVDGLAQGSQYKGRNGYYWNNTMPVLLKETGQNPITVLNIQDKPESILVVEGTTYKPSITAQRNPRSIVIGISGLQAAASSREIQQALARYKGVQVIFMPDGGSLSNPRVMQNLETFDHVCNLVGVVIQIGWWNQHKKGGTDIDEIAVDTEIEYLSFGEFKGKLSPEALVLKVGEMTATHLSKGFGLTRANLNPGKSNTADSGEAKLPTLAANNIDSYYSISNYFELYGDLRVDQKDVSELEAAILKGIDLKKKLMIDVSQTGMGKSTASALIREIPGVSRVVLMSNRFRNLTTEEAAQGYKLVPSRTFKLYSLHKSQTIPGKNDIVSTKPAEEVKYTELPGNCHLTKEFQAIQQSGWQNEIKLCGQCPFVDRCRKSSGDGYGYLHEVSEAMKETRLVSSLAFMHRLVNEDLRDTVIIFDDETPITSRTMTVSFAQVGEMILKLATSSRRMEVNEAIDFLSKIMKKTQKKAMYGFSHLQLTAGEEFTDIAKLTRVVREISAPNFEGLRFEQIEKKVKKNVDKKLGQFNFKFLDAADFTPEVLIPDFFGSLLDIMGGVVNGSCRTVGEYLEVTVADNTWQKVQEKAKLVLLLDATADKKHISMKFGVAEDDIMVISQPRQDCSNQNLIYVQGTADFSRNRASDYMGEVVTSLRKHHSVETVGILDYKGRTAPKGSVMGTKYKDNRGTNAFRDLNVLVQAGIQVPCRGAKAVEFAILTGRHVDPSGVINRDEEFETYLRAATIAEEIQAEGRTRACQSLDEQHYRYVLENRNINFDVEMEAAYPGIKISRINAVEICPKAAKKGARILHEVLEALSIDLSANLEDIAKTVERSASTISHMLQRFGGAKKTCEILYILLSRKTQVSIQAVEGLLKESFEKQNPSLVQEAREVLDNTSSTPSLMASELNEILASLCHKDLEGLISTLSPSQAATAVDLTLLHALLNAETNIMKLSETGDSIEDLVEGLEYIVLTGDMQGLEALRVKFSDDKNAMSQAAQIIRDKSEQSFETLKNMVLVSNQSKIN